MFIRINEDGSFEDYSIDQLRIDNPQVSFPPEPIDSTLADYGVYRVSVSEQPSHNPLTQQLIKSQPKKYKGKYTQKHEIQSLSYDEQIFNLKKAREEAFASEADHLFFKAQRGEIEISAWEEKVAEIRARYPYPEKMKEN
ncbi:MAG: hypothetical protein ACO24P_00255 [Candidatus Nanopelagicaceae bacterium]